ncbi:MAG: tetratricopeptide (TPR) repeat protein [Bacteriovoracaceae bacterium]|jgi:tetratricopeptide (TPR) repeat protein
MKKLLILIIFISGCSQYKIETDLSSSKEDVLSNESFLRYSSDRIEKAMVQNKSLSAIAHCHNGSIEKGQEILKSELDKRKDQADYWNQVGTCFYLNHQFVKAEYFYQLSLQTASKNKRDYAPAHNNLGVIYLRQRHFESAYSEFNKALKINKSFHTPRYNLAHLYLQFGQNEKGLNEFKYLSRTAAGDPGILAGIAISYTLLNDLKKALSYFSKIPRKFLSRPDVATHYAMALYQSKNYEQAFLILKNRQPTQIRSIRRTGNILLKLIEKELESQKLAKR